MAPRRESFEVEGADGPGAGGGRRVGQQLTVPMLVFGGLTVCCLIVVGLVKLRNREDGGSDEGPEGGGSGAPSTLVIYWARHLQSCANVAFSHKINWTEDDPALTDCGFHQGLGEHERLAADVGELDGVFSSSLLRTMQTAHALFGGTVTPLPYISEIPNGEDRSDYPVEDLRDQRARLEELGVPVDFAWMEAIPEAERVVPGKGRVQWELPEGIAKAEKQEEKRKIAKRGMHQFLTFVRSKLLKTLPRKKTPLHIAVTSHGGFIANNFRHSQNDGICLEGVRWSKWDKPMVSNGAVLRLDYQIEDDGLKPLSCRAVHAGPQRSALCAHDVESCKLGGQPIKIGTDGDSCCTTKVRQEGEKCGMWGSPALNEGECAEGLKCAPPAEPMPGAAHTCVKEAGRSSPGPAELLAAA